MYHYKIGDFECDESDEVSFYHGSKGLVFSPDEACDKYPDCLNDPRIWVYVFDYSAGRVFGLRPDIHEIRVIKKVKLNLSSECDTCKKCGAPGKRFPSAVDVQNV